VAISTPLPADLERFVHKIAEIRRERRLSDYQRDTVVLQEGRAIERERLAAMSGYHRYEEGGCDGDE
jgi:hypothetical protein